MEDSAPPATSQPPAGLTWFASSPVNSVPTSGDEARRVLFVSYAFPPTGGGGVQRSAKFAKYLPHFGWRPTILTVANPSVPVQDHDLAEELEAETPILRARTWEPGYGVKQQFADTRRGGLATLRGLLRRLGMQFLQPDPQILWNASAFRTAAIELRNQPHDAILVTGPPFSSFLLGCQLKKRFRLPLVLDFRDEWMLVGQYLENHQIRGFAYRRQRTMLRRVLQIADVVVTTTRASAKELSAYCREANSRATVCCIHNGFDPSDFGGLPTEPHSSTTFRIVYTGTLWALTDISPLARALESFQRNFHERAARVELVIAGRRTPQQDSVLERLVGAGVAVERHDYLPHRQSLELAAKGDVLLLLLADKPGATRVVPAKLFEYLALQRPILAICPEGETSQILREQGHAHLFYPEETDRIARWLEVQMLQWSSNSAGQVGSERPDSQGVPAHFSRFHLTGQLSRVLHECVASH